MSPPPNRPLPAPPLPPRPAVYNKFTQMLRDKPLELFKQYSVSPPDGAVGDSLVDALGAMRRSRVMPIGTRSQVPMDGTLAQFFRSGTKDPIAFKAGSVNRPIAWIELIEDTTRMHSALTFDAIIPGSKRTIPANHLPVWFLPWESRHLIDMTIPSRQNDDDHDPADPNIFFTAAINGCSVFVRGDPRSPTIYHGGISQGQTPYGNEPSAFWRDLLQASTAQEGINRGFKEVNNRDYINQTGISGGAQTARGDEYLRWLQNLPSGPFTISQVVPWGCVFGIRYGRLWSFYLQENATIHRYKVVAKYENRQVTEVKSSMLGLRKKEVTSDLSVKRLVKLESTVNRPIAVRDFYPGGDGGKKNFIETWQRG